jgi:hypothetical protein
MAGCKKETPIYRIPDYYHDYFIFKKGSSWIYKNDSTGQYDSTYIDSILSGRQGIGDDGRHLYSFDWIQCHFKSQFLANSEIGYSCSGPNCVFVYGRYEGYNGSNPEWTEGQFAYIDGLQPGQSTSHCLGAEVFTYENLPEVSINSIIYSNIIYSKLQSIDSSAENPLFYFREIYFAKNIGIIKYNETYKYYNTSRSWSLIRSNVIL